MIRSSKTSLKFANPGKLEILSCVIDEYKKVMSEYINILWSQEKLTKFVNKDITNQINTWLSARLLQCAGKQATAIVKGTRKKQEQRLWQINKFLEIGQFNKARKLQSVYDTVSISKPDIKNIEMELDSRFVKTIFDNNTTFDGWLELSSLGKKLKICLPFRKTKHFNKLSLIGKITKGVRISKEKITFIFEILAVENNCKNIAGVDIGVNSVLSVDYGIEQQQSGKNIHGHDLTTISERLSRRKKGSKNFRKAQEHRTNYINEQINKLNWQNIGQLNIEKIRNLRKYKNVSRKLSHFAYREILDRLKLKSEYYGVRIEEINPTYTSQRCYECGWTRKLNRKKKLFICSQCNYTCDSDINASRNIRLPLNPIWKKERLQHKNKQGFYWNVVSREPIVPNVKQAKIIQ